MADTKSPPRTSTRRAARHPARSTASAADRQLRPLLQDCRRLLSERGEDNGPGIAAAEREHVFQPFYRVLGSNVEGTGLGLPIVREIAEQHGASVSLSEARPGQQPPGARFVVRFMAPA